MKPSCIFFKGLGQYPKFKKKGRSNSFTIDNSGKPIELNGWNHKLPFIGWVKTYEPIEATTKKITISRQASDWYLSCSYEFNAINTLKTTDIIGVDLGIKTLATLSDGKVFKSVKLIVSPREAKSPITIMGQEYPVGTGLTPCIYLTHHREDLYPEPKKFKPERFLERQYSAYEFLPFGGTNRRCIGAAFAMFEMKLVLASILRRYNLALADKQPVKPVRRGVTLAPAGGVKMAMTGKHLQIETKSPSVATV